MFTITKIQGREIIDSRGNPTIEAEIFLSDGSFGRAAVPSGASTGSREAVELRDGNIERYLGQGVLNAVDNVNKIISKELLNSNFNNQKELDQILIKLDGTPNKSNLGANSILAVSMAFSKACSRSKNTPLFRYFGDSSNMPIPMMNIINGGAHADNSIDIQEFMIIPVGASSFRESLRYGVEVFHALKSVLKKQSLNTAVGDEGGFAPNLKSNREALDTISEAIRISGLKEKKDILLGLDVASSEFYREGHYYLDSEGLRFDASGFSDFLKDLVDSYPIISIEDGMDESDWEGWSILSGALGKRIQLVGDDLFEPNQIGTISETINAIDLAIASEYSAIISHRSGETSDSTISDIAVGTRATQIKTGSLSRSDRISKYNQLLRIEEYLGDNAFYKPDEAFSVPLI